MEWNAEAQARFDQLRLRELAGALTPQEEAELAALVAGLEADEARCLAPAAERLRAEHEALRERLRALQAENEELARLLSQQEQLAADGRRWLAEFEARHRLIHTAYARLTGEALSPRGSSS